MLVVMALWGCETKEGTLGPRARRDRKVRPGSLAARAPPAHQAQTVREAHRTHRADWRDRSDGRSGRGVGR